MKKPKRYGYKLIFTSTLDREDIENEMSEFIKKVDFGNISGITFVDEMSDNEITEAQEFILNN